MSFVSCESFIRSTTPCPTDFKFGKEIGQGSFSTVYVAKEIATNTEFALKVADKQHVRKNKAVESIMMEKAVLSRTRHVFIIRLYCTFQDASRLFYVLEYARGGELLGHLNRLTSFDVECARFYAAEIFTALNYLHGLDIVHRDVKPENILLTERMHIKLADFGSAIILNDPTVKAPQFTGTPEYVSPEMVSFRPLSETNESSSADSPTPYSQNDLSYLMDYWALGCIIYQFISGRPPFKVDRHSHQYEAFTRIHNLAYTFAEGFDSTAKELVQKILVINPVERLGSPVNGGPNAIYKHGFFAGINWDTLSEQVPPNLVPNLMPLAPVDWDELPVGYDECERFHLTRELGLAVPQVTENNRVQLLSNQEKQNPYHRFVRNRLILKQGILFKRRGLFAKKRMFILTEGPHLFYVDIDNAILKGEVAWSCSMKFELKNEKLFFIHIPNRTFYLETPSGDAVDWVEQLTSVKRLYFAIQEMDPISSH